MFNLNNIRNPNYAESGVINCEINHPVFGWIPFTASQDDSEAIGRGIFDVVVSGAIGEIGVFKIPVMTEEVARIERDVRLREMDAIVSNPLRWSDMTDVQKREWSDYRLALLDVPQQPDFPESIVWPSIPGA